MSVKTIYANRKQGPKEVEGAYTGDLRYVLKVFLKDGDEIQFPSQTLKQAQRSLKPFLPGGKSQTLVERFFVLDQISGSGLTREQVARAVADGEGRGNRLAA